MKCPVCQKTLADDSKFCDQCGASLETVPEEQIPEAEKEPISVEPLKKSVEEPQLIRQGAPDFSHGEECLFFCN